MRLKSELFSFKEAAEWASKYLDREVTPTNISYLVQYAKIRKYYDEQNKVKVDKGELRDYYDQNIIKKQEAWKKSLGKDLNWALSFDQLREADTTKHVHRLHPYKGKFIPQLVEYFLDNRVNKFKKEAFFKEGDIILDPFLGSGTTIIQASELGMHSIGIDVSEFNCLISKVKSDDYNTLELDHILKDALSKMIGFSNKTFDEKFETELKERLSEFNEKYFPNPEFKYKIKEGKINEEEYADEKLKQFLEENKAFLNRNGANDKATLLGENSIPGFITKWFSKRIKQELFFYLKLTESMKDEKIRNAMRVILSRTARSCRATTHSDLATLKEPQEGPYYCSKHRKICTPINTIIKHLRRNTYDTVKRLKTYSNLKKKAYSSIIHGDSRSADIFEIVKSENPELYKILERQKIAGVFTSPPYVGQIDYHEQHAYAYELFSIPRKDEKEIGPLSRGNGKQARDEYVEGISKVLLNISRFVKDDGDFFIVANDKYNLYPFIAEKSNLKIVNQFKRPVLNRTERDRQPYAEIIFHMKKV
ncbi:MAG: DNA methyltransferase [Nanoarchaeota archaeon]|nr:DNA methyltransferase [Nanoarchaeota archaeon]